MVTFQRCLHFGFAKSTKAYSLPLKRIISGVATSEKYALLIICMLPECSGFSKQTKAGQVA